MISRLLSNGLADRANAPPGQIFDVSYNRLLSQPMFVIEDVYAQLDLELREEVRATMLKQLTENPQHLHGVHRYQHLKHTDEELHAMPALARYYEEFGSYLW
jgi:ABC-type uncharacterized transport system YnjBCD ATPase subunit